MAGMKVSNVYYAEEGTFSPNLTPAALPYQNKISLSLGIFIQINPDDSIDPPLIDF
jgi:hypothetical protein